MEETNSSMQDVSMPEETAAEGPSEAASSGETTDTEAARPSQSDAENTDEAAEDTAEAAEAESAGAADSEAAAEEKAAEEPAEPQPLVRVKFNKQERAYTPEEAAPLVEMGLKWDSFKENHEKLKFLALTHGKSVGELIDLLVNSNDKLLYRQTLAECGGNEAVAQKLFEVEKSERQRKFDGAKTAEQEQARQEEQQERDQLQQRLADEYVALSKEAPGRFTQFADVPAPVVETAIKEHISLLDAYLRFEHREARKSEAERGIQAGAARRSAGSLGGERSTPDLDLDSFERAFHRALW